MAAELQALAWAGLLAAVQFVLMAVPANMQLGPAWTTGPRDEPRTLHGVAGRLNRAFLNHMEGLILFAAGVVVVVLGEATSGFTAACAWIYLAARVLYIPAYASGVRYLRSVIWSIGFLATVALFLAAIL